MNCKANILSIISGCLLCTAAYPQSVKRINVHGGTVRMIIDTMDYIAPPYKIYVDKQPFYPGGDIAFIRYIRKMLVSPTLNITNKKPDEVITTAFYVNPDGTTKGILIEKGISVDIDHKVIRIVKSSTGWKPAILNHEPVRQAYKITIGFAKL